MSSSSDQDILNIQEAADLLGVSVKTFNRVLHTENIPARKIGREWKFSRHALIEWVGSGRSADFYRDSSETKGQRGTRGRPAANEDKNAARRTAGWQIELD